MLMVGVGLSRKMSLTGKGGGFQIVVYQAVLCVCEVFIRSATVFLCISCFLFIFSVYCFWSVLLAGMFFVRFVQPQALVSNDFCQF